MIVILDYEPCDSCDGEGKMRSAFHEKSDLEQMKAADKAHYAGEELTEADDIVCPFCNGEGKLAVVECEVCAGSGLQYDDAGCEMECLVCKGEGCYVDRD